jgi:hypothetical protein
LDQLPDFRNVSIDQDRLHKVFQRNFGLFILADLPEKRPLFMNELLYFRRMPLFAVHGFARSVTVRCAVFGRGTWTVSREPWTVRRGKGEWKVENEKFNNSFTQSLNLFPSSFTFHGYFLTVFVNI